MRMAQFELKFSWWRPKEGFRWVPEGESPSGLVYEIEERLQGIDELPGRSPWLIGPPLNEEDREREDYDLSKEGPGLHREFAGLRFDRADILEFANRWGRLTSGGQVLLREIGGEAVHFYRAESLLFWEKEIQEMRDALLLWDLLGGPTGVPDLEGLRQVVVWDGDVVWFRPAGEKLWFLYRGRAKRSRQAVEAARSGDGETLKSEELQLQHLGKEIPKYLSETNRAFLGMKAIPLGESSSLEYSAWEAKRDVVGPARWFLCRMIGERLRGKVDLVIGPSRTRKDYSTSLVPADLLSAMWLELFYEVVRRIKPRRCPICGSFFDANRSPRRIYCERRRTGCRQKAARLRKKLAAAMNQGKSIEEAAKDLEIDVETAHFLLRTAKGRKG